MDSGFACINDLTIIQTTQGLLSYLQSGEQTKTLLSEKGVVVGYDSRHQSQKFAHLTSAIFLHANVPVYCFSRANPTPFVPFAVTHYGCCVGIMITASHNPKEYNGYKLYSKIMSPMDKEISKCILESQKPYPSSWNTEACSYSNPHFKDPLDEIMHAYEVYVRSLALPHLENTRELDKTKQVNITYTPFHGVGWFYANKIFSALGYSNVKVVEEQRDPDPEFPTVKFPNPEEGRVVYELAIKAADSQNASLIIANDPDADRLSFAEKQRDGSWHIFHGNEIGILLGWWKWITWKEFSPNCKCPPSDVYVISTVVSSHFFEKMARIEGFNYLETLIGFKWMGNISSSLRQAGKKVIFAYEEAIGYMCSDELLDKDGICAAFLTAQLNSYLSSKGILILEQLQKLYEQYAHPFFHNSYYICEDSSLVKRLFNSIRNFDGTAAYPTLCAGYKIKRIRDITTGYDSAEKDCRCLLPQDPKSEMITLFLEEFDVQITLRTSGTEPKIKYYSEMFLSPTIGSMMNGDASNALPKIAEDIVNSLLNPALNGLKHQSEVAK